MAEYEERLLAISRRHSVKLANAELLNGAATAGGGRTDYLNMIAEQGGKFLKGVTDSPLASAGVGAGLGGLLGAGAAHFAPRDHEDDSPNYLNGALQGALAGGALGGGASLAWNAHNKPIEAGNELHDVTLPDGRKVKVRGRDAGAPGAIEAGSKVTDDRPGKWLKDKAVQGINAVNVGAGNEGALIGTAVGSGIYAADNADAGGTPDATRIRSLDTLREGLAKALEPGHKLKPEIAATYEQLQKDVLNRSDPQARMRAEKFLRSAEYAPSFGPPAPPPPNPFGQPNYPPGHPFHVPPPAPPVQGSPLLTEHRDSLLRTGDQVQGDARGRRGLDPGELYTPLEARIRERLTGKPATQYGSAANSSGTANRHARGAARVMVFGGAGALLDYLRQAATAPNMIPLGK